MTEPIENCPIWGTKYKAEGTYDPEARIYHITDSERAFTGYKIREWLLDRFVKGMLDNKKAQLTTWLVDQFMRGNGRPEITLEVLRDISNKRPLPVHVRADRLLKLISIATRSEQLGAYVSFPRQWYYGFAWSESTDQAETEYFFDYLEKMGWLERDNLGPQIGEDVRRRVSVSGHTRVDKLQGVEHASVSSQAFVAMWFHESTAAAFEEGIKPAIVETGYDPLRIDQKEHINKIDDEIIAEIRRSKFLIADFTHGDDGARGGVYYEAGFAHGLGIPVIFTCRKDAVDTLHFDTNHYNHIVWSTPEELREGLKNRIRAIIDQVPEPPVVP